MGNRIIVAADTGQARRPRKTDSVLMIARFLMSRFGLAAAIAAVAAGIWVTCTLDSQTDRIAMDGLRAKLATAETEREVAEAQSAMLKGRVAALARKTETDRRVRAETDPIRNEIRRAPNDAPLPPLPRDTLERLHGLQGN